MDGGNLEAVSDRVKKMIDIIFSVVLAAGIILFIVTVFLVISGVKKNLSYNECNGTIVRFYENSSEGRVGSYETVSISPVVKYEVKGKEYEFIANFYSTNMKIGQETTILYDPADPSKAAIKSGTFFAPIVTGALAVVFLIAAIVYFIIKANGMI